VSTAPKKVRKILDTTDRLDTSREVQITEQTYFRWCKRYGGMGIE